MKLSVPLAVVISLALVALAALVAVLAVYAHWDANQIMALVSGSGTVLTGLIVAVGVRAQHAQTEKLAVQDRKLDTVVAQTNGLSEIERQDIARRAAATAITMHEEGKQAA